MKRLIGILTIVCMLMCTLVSYANEPPLENISWKVENGTLTISGTGKMPDYKTENSVPWASAKDEVTKIVVENGITHIGSLSFYGFTKATEAVIADSVESIGLCAFDYTEGTKTSISSITSDYAFSLNSDANTVKAGDEFTVSIILNADFKNLVTVQSILVYDDEKIAIDQEKTLDETWINSIDDTNLGYISDPLFGFVANTLRIAYLSGAGVRIDEESPLYTAGKTDVTIAKIKCKALCDIRDINTEHFMIKESEVLVAGETLYTPVCSETQLACATRVPMKTITLKSDSESIEAYAKNLFNFEKLSSAEKAPAVQVPEITQVVADGNAIAFPDVTAYKENGTVMIPIRAVYEAVGATVMWDNDTKTVFVAYGGDFFAMQIGKSTMFKPAGNTEIDFPAGVKDSRTVVPVSVFANAFGFDAVYSPELNRVLITTK